MEKYRQYAWNINVGVSHKDLYHANTTVLSFILVLLKPARPCE